ncbi:DNA cytosine methyltransferase [Microbacterium lacusdiani]
MGKYTVVEVCAGAGGQSLGLHKAGFEHRLAIEIDETAAQTLRTNGGWQVAVGDVADLSVWNPADYEGVDLFAGGVPCPPFSVAGKQLGSSDERDLFAWAIEQVAIIKPRAVMLENVRGLSSNRFAAYRQRVLDRLAELGYVGGWRLLFAADFGVPQLRPRFVLVALKQDDARYFRWPEGSGERVTVGAALRDLMAERGWKYADEWAALASDIAPTLVGGSKKHGGADLGPTRAKLAWSKLYVDGRGVADEAPGPDAPSPHVSMPRLTVEMAARIQGWGPDDSWPLAGRKTSQYRQVGNAFPPPVAEAIGRAIVDSFERVREADAPALGADLHDPVYRRLAEAGDFVTYDELLEVLRRDDREALERRIAAIHRDFQIEPNETGTAVRLGAFRGFVGQDNHHRHEFFATQRSRVS